MDEEYVDYETHRIHFHKVKQKDVEEEIIFKIQAILYVCFLDLFIYQNIVTIQSLIF